MNPGVDSVFSFRGSERYESWSRIFCTPWSSTDRLVLANSSLTKFVNCFLLLTICKLFANRRLQKWSDSRSVRKLFANSGEDAIAIFRLNRNLTAIECASMSGIMPSRPWFRTAMRPCMVELSMDSIDFRLIGVAGSGTISGIRSFTWETWPHKWVSYDLSHNS